MGIFPSVYYSDTLELIKYYLAIKVSSNAVRNIYKISNLSISYELFHILMRDIRKQRKTVI